MRRWSAIPRPVLATAAVLLAIIATLYGLLWMYDVRSPNSQVELGFNYQHSEQYDEKTRSILVNDVVKDSPAERAGLRAGDRIIAVNGRMLSTSAPYDEAYYRGRPGDPVEFTLARPGEPLPVVIHGIFRVRPSVQAQEGLAKSTAQQILASFPALFLLVGFAVLFLKLDDPDAWLLALMFCAFAGTPSIPIPLALPPAARALALTYHAIFNGLLCSLFYIFFAVFPVRSHLDRRLPWLKWVGLALGAAMVGPALRSGETKLPHAVAVLVGEHASNILFLFMRYALLALGMVALAQNALLVSVPAEARRKSRVILWGTIVGVLPIVIEKAAKDFAGYQPSYWLDTGVVLVLFLYPLSFAYAVVKHRVLEIPVLLRRSARYVLVQRGFAVLSFIVAASAIVLFTHVFSRFVRADPNVGMALSAVFGIVLVWTSAPLVKRGTVRIDRAFFRGAYDSRVILHDLSEKTRTVGDRRQLAMLLERHVREALHPKTLACYLEAGNGRLAAITGTLSATLETLVASAPALRELAQRGKTWELPPSAGADELSALAPLAPECLVPILDRENSLIGVLVLGQRLSEEPYSGEDKRLLDSVAAHAGIALENIRLAENMAERMEVDRRTAQEMEIARQVQARLFPQKLPAMKTLEYTGGCIQARKVGGDYYDFLELRPGRLGLVLADIAGKGVSGALLMANLQANLRSQYAMAVDDLPRLLTSVNRLFYESTDEASYATLFFADYDDASRKLRYANCGHLPPLLLRAGGNSQDRAPRAQRLHSNCTVLGLFETWQCEIAEVELAPGDMLVLYTDGITEATNAAGEEFGESHLLDTLGTHSSLPVGPLLQAVVGAVQQFSSGSEQQDDITLVMARSVTSMDPRSSPGL
jgi:sigma-B regulation protein RsbU (phosphoserine phosphatase)